MKISKFFGFLAMAAIVATSFASCSDDDDDEGTPDKSVALVYQKVTAEVSSDLREIANIEMTGVNMNGDNFVFGIQYADSDMQDHTTLIDQITSDLAVSFKSTIKSDYTEGVYDLSAKVIVLVELQNEDGELIKSREITVIDKKTTGVTVNAQTAPNISLLNGTLHSISGVTVQGADTDNPSIEMIY